MQESPAIEDLFEVVIEPDYSRGILKEFQKKYGISTYDFVQFYNHGFTLPIPLSDIREWLHSYKMFLMAEGDPEELIDPCENFIDTPYYDFLWEETRQAKENSEEAAASSFIYVFITPFCE